MINLEVQELGKKEKEKGEERECGKTTSGRSKNSCVASLVPTKGSPEQEYISISAEQVPHSRCHIKGK